MDTKTSEFRFGAARLDVARRQLQIDGQPAKLGGRAFDVLLALVERRDRAVDKNELFELVWPGVVVEENNLQVHISMLRKLLGPQAITTIPGRGYRFTAGVDASANSDASVAVPASTAPLPATPAVTAAPTNLPVHEQPLYGRDDDARAVGDLLRKHAHVSIVGAGGIGKTRLALAVAAAQREHFPDGVWWVELAALSDGALVAGAIAQALGIQASHERPVLETVVALLRKQTSLLVLDNCEHLQDAAAECVSALLSKAPALRILVTSQEALRTPEEQVYRLGGLPTAVAADAPAAAVELFVARAQAADPRLTLSAADLATVAEICDRLDGMPLAIELAAARVRLLGIEGLRARLDERFHVLTGGTRTVLRRHQTLRAALEWSWGLLSPDEQTVFRRLGVFVGGFTLELAQEVAADDQIDRWAVLDLLGHLVDKSLVVADGDQVPRYRLLETMRAFALEQLAAAGETPALLRRHAEALLAFLLLLEEQRETWTVATAARDGAELDNLRAALSWAESQAGDRTLACEIIGSSRRIWMCHELLNEGIDSALRLLPLPEGLPIAIEARFSLMLGATGYIGARRECFVAALRAADLYRSLGDTRRQIDALYFAALIGSRLGEMQRCADALAEAQALIDPCAPPRQWSALAGARVVYHSNLGEYETAVNVSLQRAAICRASGDDIGVQIALFGAAWFKCGLGHYDEAIPQLRSALENLQRLRAPSSDVGFALAFLANAHALRGDRDEALASGRAAAPHLQRGMNVTWMLLFIALVHARHGAEARAASLVGYYDAELSRGGRPMAPMSARVRDEILQRAQAALGPEQVRHQMTAGAALTEEQALGLAFDADACSNVTR